MAAESIVPTGLAMLFPAIPGAEQKRYFLAKNDSTSISANFKMDLNVPSGMSPEWFGIVVNRFETGLNHIS